METYDVVSVGGGIAGSIAARLAAENGMKSLLIEKAKHHATNLVQGFNSDILKGWLAGKSQKINSAPTKYSI